MKVFWDVILGRLVTDQYEDVTSDITALDTRMDAAEEAVSGLDSRMDAAEEAVSGLDSRMDAAEEAIDELSPVNNNILRQQFAFYHSGDKRVNLGDLDTGPWIEASFFPVDWRFDEWGHYGLILHFGNWA